MKHYALLIGLGLCACDQQKVTSLVQEPESAGGALSEDDHKQLLSDDPSSTTHSSTEKKPGLLSRIFGKGPRSLGPLSIDNNGIIHGPQVTQSINDSLRGDRFPANNPRAIVLHKTAGLTCNTKNGVTTVNKSDAKPHMYICQDGTIVMNGSLDYQRTRAERGHNDYTINIEFESPYIGKGRENCAAKGHILPPGVIHCYQNLTPIQAQRGREALKLISRYHNIPLTPVLPESERMNYASFVNAHSGSGIHKSRVRGVIESYQTRLGYKDNSNHDDHMSSSDRTALGLPSGANDSLAFLQRKYTDLRSLASVWQKLLGFFSS